MKYAKVGFHFWSSSCGINIILKLPLPHSLSNQPSHSFPNETILSAKSRLFIIFYISSLQVGFCNVTKREKDQMNSLWVAEATETSAHFLSFDTPHCSHIKGAAVSTERWGRISSLVWILKLCLQLIVLPVLLSIDLFLLFCMQTINRLKERVLCIIGASKG